MLPADVRESYLRHDGTDEGFFPDHAGDDVSWELLPLDRMIADAKMMRPAARRRGLRGAKAEGRQGRPASRLAFGLGSVRRQWRRGSLVHRPGPRAGGTAGQVIYSSHEMEPRKVLAKSFQKWLSEFAVALEAGEYRYEEGEGLVPG